MTQAFENQNTNPIAFYDAVADDYNKILRANSSNGAVRKKVAAYFTEVVTGKTVLDFGGGTGLDLPWLLKNEYAVYFFEPSEKMRGHAIELSKTLEAKTPVFFLNGNEADFLHGGTGNFDKKPDGVLANFAVLNSLANLDAVFKKFEQIIKPGAHIIATMLDTTAAGIAKFHKRNFIKAFLKNDEAVLVTRHGENEHISYLHTPGKIKKAAPGFICRKIMPLGGFGFMLVHLQRRI